MLRYCLLILSLITCLSAVLHAKPVQTEEAAQIGSIWWNYKYPTRSLLDPSSVTTVHEGVHAIYHIIASRDSGFVLISAEDTCNPILGYSDRGTFAYPITSAEVSDWMGQYAEMIRDVRSDTASSKETHPAWNELHAGRFVRWESTRNVGPLLTTTWDQGSPYNALCPVDASNTAGGGHAWAGCGAAAMAQVMRYWSYPVQGTGSLSYPSSYGTISANFAATTYNWDNMPTTCAPGNLDIALLMYHSAVALRTSFGPTVSTFQTYYLPMAFYQYFGYSTPSLVYRGSMAYDTWVNRVIANLDAARPVLYLAAYTSISHLFILDGYEGTDYFHINWCWSGDYDGYYYLDNLNPGGVEYFYTHGALFDLYPLASVPIRPSNLTAAFVSNHLVDLQWQDLADNESGFTIERKTGTSGTWNQLTNLAANCSNYQDTNLASYTTYYYRIKAYNDQGSSSWSNESNVITSGIIAPVVLDIAYNGDGHASLNWTSSPNAVMYRIYGANSPVETSAPDWQPLGETSLLSWDITLSDPAKFFYVKALSSFEVPQNFIHIEGGTFNNGISNVTVSSYYIDKYEVTQESYVYVMGVNPSNFTSDSSLPVEKVSWFKAIEYCNRRSILEGILPSYSYGSFGIDPDNWPVGWNTINDNHLNISCNWSASGYRLPTEMEWMFAAKGGILSQGYTYSGSEDLGSVAWFFLNAANATHPVGLKASNELGLFDMSGNVFEWVWDIYATPYPSGNQTDPHGAITGTQRVRRGGGYTASADYCTVAKRYPGSTTYINANLGFRICRLAPTQ